MHPQPGLDKQTWIVPWRLHLDPGVARHLAFVPKALSREVRHPEQWLRDLGIEACDAAHVPQRVGQAVDEPAAERARGQRPVHGVDDATLLRLTGRA